MDINLKITFDTDALVALVKERVSTIPTPVPGTFEVRNTTRYGLPEVVAEFKPAKADAEKEATPITQEEEVAVAA
ncbi:MAG: hypothetical protein KGL39_52490 [Patescibacteria group bacterium]|nr:hypothetical protein [Patescibacteria group bacterium]